MFEFLGFDLFNDFVIYLYLGNIGLVVLLVIFVMGVEVGFVEWDEWVVLFGIGFGINCVMMCVDWVVN